MNAIAYPFSAATFCKTRASKLGSTTAATLVAGSPITYPKFCIAPITCCSKNIDRSASRWTGLSVLFGPKGVPLGSLAKGGSSLGLERPLPLGVSGGEDMEARFATAASLGFLVQVAHMRHRPACYLPIPFGALLPLGTCGYRSSPSSKTAHRKSSRREPTRSGFCSSFPIRKLHRTRTAKPHSVDFRLLRSDAGSWHPLRAGLRRRTRT